MIPIEEVTSKSIEALKAGPRADGIRHQIEKLAEIQTLIVDTVEIYNALKYSWKWFDESITVAKQNFTKVYAQASTLVYAEQPVLQLHDSDNWDKNVKMINEYFAGALYGSHGILMLKAAVITESLRKEAAVAAEIKAAARAAQSRFENLVAELERRAVENVAADYAETFSREAEKESSSLSDGKLFGRAERWLTLGVVSVVALVIAILVPSIRNVALAVDYSSIAASVSGWFLRLVLLGTVLFLIRFSFRQYTISRHLYTLNNHRANALNSYRLFMDSISPDDGQTRNALLLEVAKSIYDCGPTGYLDSKSTDVATPSIVELTRYTHTPQ